MQRIKRNKRQQQNAKIAKIAKIAEIGETTDAATITQNAETDIIKHLKTFKTRVFLKS